MGRIWRLPEEVRARYDVSSLKTVWHLAAPCPAWLKEEWIAWLGEDMVMELYGGTEGQARTIITGREWLAHKGSVGRVYPGGEMKAVDAQGNDLPPGQTGEIYMRRAADVPPTYRYVGAEARTLPGGWESLGDIGWFDEDGYLYLADRRTDMILVGGANVYPAEVEAAIDEHRAGAIERRHRFARRRSRQSHPCHRADARRSFGGRTRKASGRASRDLQTARARSNSCPNRSETTPARCAARRCAKNGSNPAHRCPR